MCSGFFLHILLTESFLEETSFFRSTSFLEIMIVWFSKHCFSESFEPHSFSNYKTMLAELSPNCFYGNTTSSLKNGECIM